MTPPCVLLAAADLQSLHLRKSCVAGVHDWALLSQLTNLTSLLLVQVRSEPDYKFKMHEAVPAARAGLPRLQQLTLNRAPAGVLSHFIGQLTQVVLHRDSIYVPMFEDVARLTRLQKLVVISPNSKLFNLFCRQDIPNLTLL
jgi:hypothetical protein